MVDIELFLWHSPPGEIKLLPWSNILGYMGESVVAFRSQEILSNSLPVVEIGNSSSEQAGDGGTISDERSLLRIHFFDQAFG